MPEYVLETRQLTRRYGDLVAVNDLSLQIIEGEIFGFLGPNGAGKTTSINLMCGLLPPTSGETLLRGKPILNGDARNQRLVGVCPQNIVLWERLTCLEQLVFIGQMYGLPGRRARANAWKLLEELDLMEKANQQARKLSGGMQRRLNIAMALVHDPEIIVLDEPEAGLDPQSRVKVRDTIHSLARKKTVILTTHDMDEADRLADRVAIIDHGHLLVLDTPEQLKQRLGEGDVVEIQLEGAGDDQAVIENIVRRVINGQTKVDITFDVEHQVLKLRLLNAAVRLSAILDALMSNGCVPGEISIRPNTLEDVFIQLTGRKLRE